jgi:hypothetical protein
MDPETMKKLAEVRRGQLDLSALNIDTSFGDYLEPNGTLLILNDSILSEAEHLPHMVHDCPRGHEASIRTHNRSARTTLDRP